MTDLQKQFASGCQPHDDMLPHMEQVRSYAQGIRHATEFGVRAGASTLSILCGMEDTGGGALHSYDHTPPTFQPAPSEAVAWHFQRADTSKLDPIQPTELLFIDTLHTADQVAAELRHAPHVSNLILLHDVVMFGSKGEENGLGINPAIYDFLAANWREWHVHAHHRSAWGLLVLKRHHTTTA